MVAVDLVDVDLNVDLVDHDFVYLLNFLRVAKLLYLLGYERRECAESVSFGKCCRMH